MARRRRSRRSKSDPISIILTIVFVLILAKCMTGGSSNKSNNVRNQANFVTQTTVDTPTTWPTWTPLPTITPRPTMTPIPTKTSPAAGCLDPSCGCVIKGNINSEGKKIYHCPNSPNYDEIMLNRYGERYFCTEEEAIAAGFTMTSNTKYCGF